MTTRLRWGGRLKLGFHLSWIAAAAAVFFSLGPVGHAGENSLFNSDTAITWMMAYSDRLDPYELFFYGQDRFGSWYFKLVGILTFFFQEPYLPEFFFKCVLYFGAAYYFFRRYLEPKQCFALVLFLAAIVQMDGVFQRDGLTISQPYGSQVALLLLYLGYPHERRWLVRTGLAFLSCWLSILSGVFIIAYEGIRFLQRNRGFLKSPSKIRFRGEAVYLAPVLIGIVCERTLSAAYRWYVHVNLIPKYPGVIKESLIFTKTLVSIPMLKENFPALLHNFWIGAPYQVVLAITLATVILGFLRLRGIHALARDERGIFVSLGVACLCLIVAVASTGWVKMNGNLARYILPSIVMFYVLLMLALGFVLRTFRSKAVIGFLWVLGPLLAAMPIHLRQTAIKEQWRLFEEVTEQARRIREFPEKIIYGGYWQSYVWQGLIPEMRAVADSSTLVRVPQSLDLLAGTHNILFCHPPGNAPATLSIYGIEWRLVKADALGTQWGSISRYERL